MTKVEATIKAFEYIKRELCEECQQKEYDILSYIDESNKELVEKLLLDLMDLNFRLGVINYILKESENS